MPQEIKPPLNCPKCGSKVAEFKGVSRQTGKPYHFWGCVNPDCRWIWRQSSNAQTRHEEEMKALRILYTEIEKIKKMVEKLIEEERTIPPQ